MTFTPISYVYAPTAPRSKRTKSGYKTTEHVGNSSKKNQHIQPSSTASDTLQLLVAEDADGNGDEGLRVEAETTTPNGDENDDSFPPIEEILYAALQKRGLGVVGEHCSTANAGRGEEVEAFLEQRDNAICDSTSTSSHSLGNNQDDPIVVGDDSNLSETVESDFWSGSVGAGSQETEASPFSPATTPGSRDSATLCRHLDPAELACSAVVSVLDVLDENEHPALVPNSKSDIFDEETQQRRHTGGEGDGSERGTTSPDEQYDAAASLIAEGPVNALSDNEGETVRSIDRDPSPCLSQGRSSGQIDIHRDSEFDSYSARPDESARRRRPAKRKRPSSPGDGPAKKRKPQLQTSTGYSGARLDGAHRSERSPTPHSGHSTSSTKYNTKGRLPSPVPSIAHTTDTDMRSCRSGLGRPSSDSLPKLTEMTFRLRSPHSCSFTAVVRDGREGQGVSFSQLAQLIEGMGYVGELDDFTIKPLQQESLLLTGVCHHPASQLSPGCPPTLPRHTRAHNPSNNAVRTRLRHGRAGRAVVSRESTAGISDDDSLSDSNPDPSSDNDGCYNEDEQHRSTTRKHIPWDEIDEQRLRVYKEEGKAWKWIFKKFPARTEPAIRMRWTMMQQRAK